MTKIRVSMNHHKKHIQAFSAFYCKASSFAELCKDDK